MGAMNVEPMKPIPAAGELLADAPSHRWPVHIGIDVGQVQNPTAIVAVEVVQRATGRLRASSTSGAEPDPRLMRWTGSGWVELVTETVYLTRHLERVPLGTRYPDVALRIADVVCSPKLAGRPRRVLIDQTGVGRPIVELVSDAITTRTDAGGGDVSLRPIIFTSGMEYDPWTGKMGKAYMVSRLQALLQWERLMLPQGHVEAGAMRAELRTYSIKVSQDGADTYGAMKIGQFDDLATALGLACLEDPNDTEARSIPFNAQGWH